MKDVCLNFDFAVKNKFLILLMAIMALPSGCKKEKNPSATGNPVFNGKITCEIDGVPWRSSPEKEFLVNSNDDTIYGFQAHTDGDYLVIYGCRFSDSSVVYFQIDPLLPGKTGTYIDSTGDYGFAVYFNNIEDINTGEDYYENSVMKVVITSWDTASKKFSGTFEGDFESILGNDFLKIRNGKINNMTYTVD